VANFTYRGRNAMPAASVIEGVPSKALPLGAAWPIFSLGDRHVTPVSRGNFKPSTASKDEWRNRRRLPHQPVQAKGRARRRAAVSPGRFTRCCVPACQSCARSAALQESSDQSGDEGSHAATCAKASTPAANSRCRWRVIPKCSIAFYICPWCGSARRPADSTKSSSACSTTSNSSSYMREQVKSALALSRSFVVIAMAVAMVIVNIFRHPGLRQGIRGFRRRTAADDAKSCSAFRISWSPGGRCCWSLTIATAAHLSDATPGVGTSARGATSGIASR
jgi:hypothetical protein